MIIRHRQTKQQLVGRPPPIQSPTANAAKQQEQLQPTPAVSTSSASSSSSSSSSVPFAPLSGHKVCTVYSNKRNCYIFWLVCITCVGRCFLILCSVSNNSRLLLPPPCPPLSVRLRRRRPRLPRCPVSPLPDRSNSTSCPRNLLSPELQLPHRRLSTAAMPHPSTGVTTRLSSTVYLSLMLCAQLTFCSRPVW